MNDGMIPTYDAALGRSTALGNLLKDVTAPAVSPWVRLGLMRPWVLTVVGDIIGTMNIRVTNQVEKPTKPTSHYPILDVGGAITGADSRAVNEPVMWVMLEVASVSSGTLDTADIAAG